MNVIETQTMLPVVTVDGAGFETADPVCEINFGDAVVYTEKGEKVLWEKTSAYRYAVVGSKGGKVTVAALDMSVLRDEESQDVGIKYGAATADGKIITDCIYDRLSAFYGGYAVGIKVSGENASYYRIDESGREELINDMYVLKDGVYIFSEGEKVGLKNYAGEVLLKAEFDSLSVSDNYMLGGEYQRSIVIATVGVKSYVYTLR